MNIGKHIEEILRKQGKSAAWLATQIPCERTNVYNIFKRKSLDARLLMRISVILEHDFFKELSEEAFPKAKWYKPLLLKGSGFYFSCKGMKNEYFYRVIVNFSFLISRFSFIFSTFAAKLNSI